MVKINGCDIQLARGDSLNLRVDLGGRDLPEGTDAVFTLKKHVRSDEVLLQKRFNASDEIVSIALSPRETNLTPGMYLWDLRLQIPQENGGYEVVTPMDYAAFVVVDVIGEDLGNPDDPGFHPDLPLLQQTMAEAKQIMLSTTEAVARAENVANAHAPYIGQNTNWWYWDYEAGAYVDSGVSAAGVPMGLDHVDAEKLGGKAPQYYLPAVNLLENSDFVNLINRMGAVSNTVSNSSALFVDRWMTYQGNAKNVSYAFLGSGLQLSSVASVGGAYGITQQLSGALENGKTYTLAAMIDGKVYAGSFVKQDFAGNITIGSYTNISLVFMPEYYNRESINIRFSDVGGSHVIKWAALYEGAYTADNVPPFVENHPRAESLRLGYAVHPRNLLDNSWWKQLNEIVNQRGQTTYETGYTIDRWWMNNGTCVVGENGITVRPNNNDVGSTFLQYLDSIDINKVYTFAVADSNGNIYIIHSVPRQRVETNTSFGKMIAKCLPDVLPAFAVELPPGGASVTFVWAALYEGFYTAENLPPYVPKGYAVELAECMRYFQKSKEIIVSTVADNAGYYDAVFPLMTPMIRTPSITVWNSANLEGKMNIFVAGMNWMTVDHSQRLTTNTMVSARGSGVTPSAAMCVAFKYEASADL